MKIIKKGIKPKNIKKVYKHIECDCCGTIFQIEEKDIEFETDEIFYCKCPVCKKKFSNTFYREFFECIFKS